MPAARKYPGIYIEEIPRGARPIEGVVTSITAFVGRTSRGPTNIPWHVSRRGGNRPGPCPRTPGHPRSRTPGSVCPFPFKAVQFYSVPLAWYTIPFLTSFKPKVWP